VYWGGIQRYIGNDAKIKRSSKTLNYQYGHREIVQFLIVQEDMGGRDLPEAEAALHAPQKRFQWKQEISPAHLLHGDFSRRPRVNNKLTKFILYYLLVLFFLLYPESGKLCSPI